MLDSFEPFLGYPSATEVCDSFQYLAPWINCQQCQILVRTEERRNIYCFHLKCISVSRLDSHNGIQSSVSAQLSVINIVVTIIVDGVVRNIVHTLDDPLLLSIQSLKSESV